MLALLIWTFVLWTERPRKPGVVDVKKSDYSSAVGSQHWFLTSSDVAFWDGGERQRPGPAVVMSGQRQGYS